jgi:hypothetical protein
MEPVESGRGLATEVDVVEELGADAYVYGTTEIVGCARPDDVGITRLLRRAGLRPAAEIFGTEVRLRAALPTPVG